MLEGYYWNVYKDNKALCYYKDGGFMFLGTDNVCDYEELEGEIYPAKFMEWVSSKDRLPEKSGNILILMDSTPVIAYYDIAGHFIYSHPWMGCASWELDVTTYWMPLPNTEVKV